MWLFRYAAFPLRGFSLHDISIMWCLRYMAFPLHGISMVFLCFPPIHFWIWFFNILDTLCRSYMYVLLYSIFWLLSRGSCLFFFFTFSTVFSHYFFIILIFSKRSDIANTWEKGHYCRWEIPATGGHEEKKVTTVSRKQSDITAAWEKGHYCLWKCQGRWLGKSHPCFPKAKHRMDMYQINL